MERVRGKSQGGLLPKIGGIPGCHFSGASGPVEGIGRGDRQENTPPAL